MVIEVFLTKLKSFSINYLLVFIFFLYACSSPQIPIRKPFPYSPAANGLPAASPLKSSDRQNLEPPPWEVWELQDFGVDSLRIANRAIRDGKLDLAIEKYQDSLSSLQSSEQAEYALMMISSTFLKSDKPNECLGIITKYASKRGLHAGQLDARFSLLAAFSYLRMKDLNQSLAWFSQAFKAASGSGVVAESSRKSARKLISQQTSDSLSTLKSKWSTDTFISSLLREEQERRLRGGTLVRNDYFDEYYNSRRYSIPESPVMPTDDSSQRIQTSDIHQAPTSIEPSQDLNQNDISKLKVGIMLPLSGPYAQHAQKVLKGIQLKLDQSGVLEPLAIIDTNTTNVTIGYQNLVRDHNVKIVFGPLLLKDAEEIASLSAQLKIPVLTFVKKRGLPETSVGMYRLGATAENQISEIIRIAGQNSRIALLVPEDDLGAEFKDAAESLQSRGNPDTITTIPYMNNSFESITKAVDMVASLKPDGIMLVDSPQNLEAVIREIKSNNVLQSAPLYGSAITADFKHLGSYITLLDGMRLVSFFNPTSKNFSVVSFIDEYKSRYTETPDLLAAQGFDAALFVTEAFRRNTGTELEVLSSLSQIQGVTGLISNTPVRDLQRTTRIVYIKNKNLLEE